MHAFDVLGDPVRRRILEILAQGEHASGQVVEIISEEFGITQSAVSQQLKVLRQNGFASVRAEGTRRLYSVDGRALAEWVGYGNCGRKTRQALTRAGVRSAQKAKGPTRRMRGALGCELRLENASGTRAVSSD